MTRPSPDGHAAETQAPGLPGRHTACQDLLPPRLLERAQEAGKEVHAVGDTKGAPLVKAPLKVAALNTTAEGAPEATADTGSQASRSP